ncbi:MAG TPA: lamin tail domain-containing protein [Kofleriaceae bacterium]|nr:lamin tail domain-containing protein [Kofleriaceae bacterium]
MSWKHVILGCAAFAGCAEGGPRPPGGFEREVRGGALHADAIRGVAADAVAMDEVLRTAVPLRAAFHDVTAADLDPSVRTTEAGGAPLTSVYAGQVIDGVPIHGAYVYLATHPDGDGGGELVGSSYHLFQGAAVDTTPEVAEDAAVSAARDALRVDGGAPARSAALEIWPLDGELTLVWDVVVEGANARGLVIAGGPRAGRVEVVDDRLYETHGTVTGWVATGGAPGGHGTARQVPLAEVDVHAGGASVESDRDGTYTIDAASGSTITAVAAGRAARVESADPTAVVGASARAAANVDLVVGSAAGERPLAVVTAYQAVERAHAFLLANGVTAEELGGPVDVIVNEQDTCNAYYSPPLRRLNFYRSGGGCRNSAETTIATHEYGHVVDDTFGGITNGGLSEGWGDLLACLVTKQPVIGPDLFDEGGIIRTCDNDYIFPPSGRADDVHDLGQAWSGFGWHLRAALIDELGPAAGDELARELLLPSFVTNAPDIPTAVREAFLRDDDDGDLRNHTPHWDALIAAARRHGLDFVADQDLAPPAAIADLAASAVSATRVELTWTAPGDDAGRGSAARYELRWSAAPITEANFAAAAQATAPKPAAAGAHQTVTIAVPPVGRVYVALRAEDELGNTAPLSNVALASLPAPATVFDDGAEHGLGDWKASGLWHVTKRQAGHGAASFWYGQEATGNYDTGARNHGTLLSPVIDLAGAKKPVLAWTERIDVEGDTDHDTLTVSAVDVDDPDVSIEVDKPGGWTGTFAPRILDLSRLAGHRVQLHFDVDTVDRNRNQGLGWSIDDVRVIADQAPGMPAPPPPPQQGGGLIVNEALVDPPDGFDANGDGSWSSRADEFVELVNTGAAPLDLGGATLSDSAQVRVTFAAGTVVAPGKALVVFGGAAPRLTGVVTVGSDGLFLNNDGDSVTVRRADGTVLADLRWGAEAGHDQSLTREIDGDPDSPMVGHLTRSSAPASPGTRADGRPF